MSKRFPAMAIVGQSAGPAQRPGDELFQFLYSSRPGVVPAHSYLAGKGNPLALSRTLHHVAGKDNALAAALSRAPVDTEAAKSLTWLRPSARADSEVLFKILPELRPHLTPHDYDVARGCRAWRQRRCWL